jgi:hypothetical protein
MAGYADGGWDSGGFMGSAGESSQGMDNDAVGSGLGSDFFGNAFGAGKVSNMDRALAMQRARLGLPAIGLPRGISRAMQKAWASGANPWSGQPIGAGVDLGQLSGEERAAVLSGTKGTGGLSQNYGRLSGALGPTIGLNTDPAALAAVEKARAHFANITTQKSPFNQELENFAQTIGKTGQNLNTQDMQSFDKAVRAGKSFATAPGINSGSYDDEGMPAWGGFGYMDPTQGPGAPNNQGWDAGEFSNNNLGYNAGEFAGNNLGWSAGEFGPSQPGGYNMTGNVDGGGDGFLPPRRVKRNYEPDFIGGDDM